MLQIVVVVVVRERVGLEQSLMSPRSKRSSVTPWLSEVISGDIIWPLQEGYVDRPPSRFVMHWVQ